MASIEVDYETKNIKVTNYSNDIGRLPFGINEEPS